MSTSRARSKQGRYGVILVALSSAGALALASCGTSDPFLAGPLDAGLDTATDSSIVVDSDGRTCDLAKSPRDETCINDDRFTVYVSPTGDDSNPGTKASPKKTIGAALVAAQASNKRHVIACADTFEERVTLDFPVQLHGAFKCSDWSYDAAKRTLVKPTAPGYALHIKNVSAAVVEDFDFESADAADAGGSSIAGFVASSQNVILRRVKLKAGNAKDATDAPQPTSNMFAQSPDGNGARDGGLGAEPKTCACPIYGNSSGGGGGNGGFPTGGDGGAGTASPQANAVAPNFDGRGGEGATSATGCQQGRGGSPGAARAPGTGATVLGTLSATGWAPTPGRDGEAGNPGQGGGGGGGSRGTPGSGGGGGGCGGCGGAGGKGGLAGGASIALAIFQSAVILEASSFETGDAGKGGKASTGEQGGGGGGGGTLGACSGGAGAPGAGGGGGGGGAGGVVAGVLWTGTSPTIDGTLATTAPTHPAVAKLGSPGLKGLKGAGGPMRAGEVPEQNGFAGPDGTDGIDGVARALLSL